MRTQRQIPIVLLVLAMVPLLMAPGCKDQFPVIAKASLESMQIAYDTGFSIMGDLYKEGKMSEQQKEMAISIGDKYIAAYDVAVDAVAAYVAAKDSTGEGSAKLVAIQTLAELMKYYDDFIKLIEEIRGSPLPGSEIPESDRDVLAGN